MGSGDNMGSSVLPQFLATIAGKVWGPSLGKGVDGMEHRVLLSERFLWPTLQLTWGHLAWAWGSPGLLQPCPD